MPVVPDVSAGLGVVRIGSVPDVPSVPVVPVRLLLVRFVRVLSGGCTGVGVGAGVVVVVSVGTPLWPTPPTDPLPDVAPPCACAVARASIDVPANAAVIVHRFLLMTFPFFPRLLPKIAIFVGPGRLAWRARVARLLSLVSLPLLLAYLVSAGGCSEPSSSGEAVHFDACEPVTVVPAAALTTGQEAGVRAAIGLWNTTAGTQLLFDADPSAVVAGARLPIRFQAAAAAFHGFYDEQTGSVFINLDLVDRAQTIAIAHELGHGFALVHTTAHPSVMRPGNLDTEPSAADADALVALWGACPTSEDAATE